VCPDKFLTGHAYKYIGCCLIATNDPLEYSKTHLYPIVEKLKEKVGIKNINTDYEKYKKNLKKFEEEIDSINQKYTQESKIDEELEKIMHRKPEFKFPTVLELNTHSHIETFSKYVKSYEKSVLKIPITHDSIDITEFDVDEEIKFLLYMGVGLYTKKLDPEYCNLVLEMLSDRKLAYIIADESFCYGANYQISNVIINDDIGNTHSINTILQLIGRTSRVGKSWSGKVYLDENTCKRIIHFFNDPCDNSNEGKNISKSFYKIIDVINKENEKIRLKEHELELAKIKEKELKELEKKKEEELKLKKEEEKKARVAEEKMSWRDARRGERPVRVFRENFNNDSGNDKFINGNDKFITRTENYKIPAKEVNEEWGNLRSKRENIVKKDSDKDKIYRPGAFKTEPVTEYKPKETIKVQSQNKNFREQKEDELFGILFSKKATQSRVKKTVDNKK
jgi:hypothetical protein